MTVNVDSATVHFTQEGNTVGTTEDVEDLSISLVTQLPGEAPFIVLQTSGWSIDSVDDLQQLIDRCLQLFQTQDGEQ